MVWLTDSSIPESVFGILRRSKDDEVVTLVNLGAATEGSVGTQLSGGTIAQVLEVGEPATIRPQGSKIQVVLGARSAVIFQIDR